MHPSINNIKHINNKTFIEGNSQSQNLKVEISESEEKAENTEPVEDKKAKRKKVAPKKEKVFAAPRLTEAVEFFKSENYPEVEARKFFYHFESTDGKSEGNAFEKLAHRRSSMDVKCHQVRISI